MSGNRYDAYERLKIDWPADGVLRLTMHNPDNPLNSVDGQMHRGTGLESGPKSMPTAMSARSSCAAPAGPIRRAATSA